MTDQPGRDDVRTPDTHQTGGRGRTPGVERADHALIARIASATVLGAQGEKIGRVGRVYVDDSDGTPSWVSVRSGLLGMRESLVPIEAGQLDGDHLRVPYAADVVKKAPQLGTEEHVAPGEEGELHAYYRSHGWAGRSVTEETQDDVVTEENVRDGGPLAAGAMVEQGRSRLDDERVHVDGPADDVTVVGTGTGAGAPTEQIRVVDGPIEGTPVETEPVRHTEPERVDVERVEVERVERVERVDVEQPVEPVREEAPQVERIEQTATIERAELVREPIEGAEPAAGHEFSDEVVAEEVLTEEVVTEAVVTEPVRSEPVVSEPVVSEPVVSEPVVAEPVVETVRPEPVVAEHVATEPVVEPAREEPFIEPVREQQASEREQMFTELERDEARSEELESSAAGSAAERPLLVEPARRPAVEEKDVPVDEPLREQQAFERDQVYSDPERGEERNESLDALVAETTSTTPSTEASAPSGTTTDAPLFVEPAGGETGGGLEAEPLVAEDVQHGQPAETRDSFEFSDTAQEAQRDEQGAAGLSFGHASLADRSADGEHVGFEAAEHERRISGPDEVVDGGYGIGSAAPLYDGAQPLGHAVRAWEDTRSYREGPSPYIEREPDVWFMDAQAAENAGFHQAEHWV